MKRNSVKAHPSVRPFSSKLRRMMTKKMRRRIKKTSAKVNMVKKTLKADGSVSVYPDSIN